MESARLFVLFVLVSLTSPVHCEYWDTDGLVLSTINGNTTLKEYCAFGIPTSDGYVEPLPTDRLHLINWLDKSTSNNGPHQNDHNQPLAVLIQAKHLELFQSSLQPVLFLLNEDDPDRDKITPSSQQDLSHAVLKPTDFDELVKLSSSPNNSQTMITIFRDPKISRQLELFNPAILLIYGIALLSIVLGCTMVFMSYEDLLREMQARNAVLKNSKWAIYIALGVLLVLASGFILIYYYFYDIAVYFAIALFFCCGIFTITNVLTFWITYCFPRAQKKIPVNFTICRSHVDFSFSLTKLVIAPVGIAVMVAWVIFRKDEFVGWHIQSVVGIFMVAWLLSSGIPLPSLKLITICFAMFLAYDVFFVFITPYFQSNTSVTEVPPPAETHVVRSRRSISNEVSYMEAIATGSAGKSGETIPASFRIHIVLPTGQYGCRHSPYSILLGFGDAIFPGLLCAFLAFYDSLWKIRLRMNFFASLLGYILGMLTTQFVMTLTDRGQPALLYLCPCTLGVTVLVTAMFLGKEELRKMWKGAFPLIDSPEHDQLNPCSGGEPKNDGMLANDREKSTDLLFPPEHNGAAQFSRHGDSLQMSVPFTV